MVFVFTTIPLGSIMATPESILAAAEARTGDAMRACAYYQNLVIHEKKKHTKKKSR